MPAVPLSARSRAAARAVALGLVASAGLAGAEAPTGEDAFQARRRAVETAFTSRGARAVTPVRVAFVTEGRGFASPLPATEGHCAGVVALARSPQTQLSLRVLNGRGVAVASVESPGPAPALRVCTSADETLAAVVSSSHGAGEVALLFVQDPPTATPDLAALLGDARTRGLAARPEPRPAIGPDPFEATVRDRLDRLVTRLADTGYTLSRAPEQGTFTDDRPAAIAVSMREGECRAFASVARERTVRLELVTSDNHVLLRTAGESDQALLPWCASASFSGNLLVRAAGRGTGNVPYWLATLELGRGLRAPSQLVGALRGRWFTIATEAQAHGMHPWEPPVVVLRAPTLRAAHRLPVRAGHCYLFGAASSVVSSAVELSVFDDDGGWLGTAGPGAEARVTHCFDHDATVRLEHPAARADTLLVSFESESLAP